MKSMPYRGVLPVIPASIGCQTPCIRAIFRVVGRRSIRTLTVYPGSPDVDRL